MNTAWKVKLLFFMMCLLSVQALFAHTINYALESSPTEDIVWYYFRLGFRHIIPEGLDHILFVAGLCLLSTKVKTIIWQATAFTAAHSLTLALSMKNMIVAPFAIVEPIIALSIVFIAIENMILTKLKPWRILIVFLFGLMHGMGFASVLNETGLPPGKFYTSILSFNVGVEAGQVAIIIALFLCIIQPLKNKPWYRKGIVFPLSALIAVIATYWTISRIY